MAFPSRLFCDTSFFYACHDPNDSHHDRAEALTAAAVASSAELVTTWDIVGETVTLLRYRMGFRPALRFLEEIKPHLAIIEYGPQVRQIFEEAERAFRQRSRSRRLSFCDAISFIVVTRLLGNMPCLAFDRDFRALGLTVIL
jgi:predicted nucleic acid-binding protein